VRAAPKYVIFDFGGVLIDWNPRHLYRELIGNDEVMEDFLGRICTQDWNREQDGGRGTAEATALLVRQHPEHKDWIEAYYGQFDRMMKSEIAGSVAILRELKANGVPLFCLSNASADTFPLAERRFDFLALFDDILVSGREGLLKPDPAIFRLAERRFGVVPEETIFIDDHPPNVESAAELGYHAVHFTAPESLRRELSVRGRSLLP
jgi:2-haloacid dehalogenase